MRTTVRTQPRDNKGRFIPKSREVFTYDEKGQVDFEPFDRDYIRELAESSLRISAPTFPTPSKKLIFMLWLSATIISGVVAYQLGLTGKLW